MEIQKHKEYLPAKPEELQKFILVGRERLNAIRAELNAMDKVGVQKWRIDQRREETQLLAEDLLDAEVKMGEYVLGIKKSNKWETMNQSNTDVTLTKQSQLKRLNICKMQASRYETLAKHKDIVEQVKGEARESDDLVTRNSVLSEIKKKERFENIENIKKKIDNENIENINKLYDVVVVDPPWDYGNIDNYDSNTFRGTVTYPTMSIEQIKNIKIPVKENSVLWLWTTQRHIQYSFEILKYWGFEYKVCLTWCKNKMGIGKWLRSKSEFCLLGIKGRPLWNLTNETTLLNADIREHSRKPDVFYDMVNSLCHGLKLDYFAREQRQGWSVYGAETKKF